MQQSEKAKIEARRKAVLAVDGKTVVADMKGKTKTFNQFWEDADMAVVDDAYRRAARNFSPDITPTYVDALAYRLADPQDAAAFEEALVEARVSVAALGLVTELQPIFDAEADKLAKAWLATHGAAIKRLSHDRQESYRQVREVSAEPQDVDLVKPEGRFEPTKMRMHDVETTLPSYRTHLCMWPTRFQSWQRLPCTLRATPARTAASSLWRW